MCSASSIEMLMHCLNQQICGIFLPSKPHAAMSINIWAHEQPLASGRGYDWGKDSMAKLLIFDI